MMSEDIQAPGVKRFDGGFMVFRMKSGRHLSKRLGGQKLPWFRHPTLEDAEKEATRLNATFPDSTFAIMQMVSRVKAQPALPDAPQEA
jgi:hypothetical protein